MTGVVVWFTGLPASGKSTLAATVCERMRAMGIAACTLDSDRVREAVFPQLGYGESERVDFYDKLGRLGALLAEQGLAVLIAATAHRRQFRQAARARCPAFIEVLVAATPEQCATRDVKGLYRAVRAGEVVGLPGIDIAYEPPERPDVVASGGLDGDAAARVVGRIVDHIRRPG